RIFCDRGFLSVSSALSASCRHWLAITPYRRLVPEVSAASLICWHFSAFARYRSDRDNIKPSRFISGMRKNDLQSAKVWPTSGRKQRGLGQAKGRAEPIPPHFLSGIGEGTGGNNADQGSHRHAGAYCGRLRSGRNSLVLRFRTQRSGASAAKGIRRLRS